MRSTLLHPIYIVAVGLAAINQLLEKAYGIFLPFVHSYLDDLLCFPIVLTTGLFAYRIVWPSYRLTVWHIWPLFVVMVFVFEIYLPSTSPMYTTDGWDILAYFIGIMVFQFTINQFPKQIKRHKKTASIA